MNSRSVLATMLLLVMVAGCVPTRVPIMKPTVSPSPDSITAAVAEATVTPARDQKIPSRQSPQLLTGVDASNIVRAVENWELDSQLKVTIRDGIDLVVSSNPGASFSGWDIYYVKDWSVRLNDGSLSTNPDRRLYWAVAKFSTASGMQVAIISVEGDSADKQIMPWSPCNDGADLVMSRVFGGPSYGTGEFSGTRCTSANGQHADVLIH